MTITTFKCDRCGAELGENSSALERQRLLTVENVHYSISFIKRWRHWEREYPTKYELCESCRESLERWLENG